MRRGSYDDVAAPIRPHLRSLAQRRRSAPTLLFGKALGMSWSPIREEAPYTMAIEQCPFVLGLTTDNSELILEETVQLTEGMKTRERHLFLLTDALVIAKLKPAAGYRLKHRVNLEDLWVCVFKSEDDEVENEEGDVNLKTTVAVAWSLCLCLVTFSSPEVKERWIDTLHRTITEARKRTGAPASPPSILMKVLSSTTTNKTLSGGGMDSVIELPLQGNGKISALAAELCKQDLQQADHPIEHEGTAVAKRGLFSFRLKRSSTHTGLPIRSESKKNLLFGQALPRDGSLPKPITELLVLLWRKAPSTEGVFRTACNNKNLNALREQLDSGAEVEMEALPVSLLVGLLKTFLRELPGSLLVSELYDEWMKALEKKDEQKFELKRMIEKLPEGNRLLLHCLLCLFHHISQQSEANKMDAKNLSVCIAPTLLIYSSQSLDRAVVEKVTNLTQFLIENCCELFGEKIVTILGDPEEEELGDNSDSISSHQHDSAYDSTDPDGDVEGGEAIGLPCEEDGTLVSCQIRIECSPVPSCSSDAIFDTFTKPFNRRCSEPSIFPSATITSLRNLTRSHDDCSANREEFVDQPLKKQVSDDSFLHPRSCERRNLASSLNAVSLSAPISKACSCSSTCSVDSATSNVSESSVFASSPMPSPSNARKNQPARHSSLAMRSRADSPKTDAESKRHFPFKRAKSLSSFSSARANSKKGESQKDVAFSCETLQEDSQKEAESQDEPARRPRPLSAIEVFKYTDSRYSCPPTYEQALLSAALPAPPQYRSMTVRDAQELGRKSRPISMNDYILDASHVNQLTDSLIQYSTDNSVEAPQQVSFRQRAMSESVAHCKTEKLGRRCSQPVFEELSCAKESYV